MHLQMTIYENTLALLGTGLIIPHCQLKWTMEGMMEAWQSSGSMTAECFKVALLSKVTKT